MTFKFGKNFELSIWCDVLPKKIVHILLGRPWFFMKGSSMIGMKTLIRDGHKKILRPMKEIPPLKQPKEKLVPSNLEELSNTEIKKQVDVTRKKSSLMNSECN